MTSKAVARGKAKPALGAPAVSIAAPCYNEEASLEAFCARAAQACRQVVGEDFEIVLVDDGSTDGTWRTIRQLSLADSRVRGIRLSRNYGHQIALTAGLAATLGQRILMIDADLQDPPELLSEMMGLMDQGYDVVYGRRSQRLGESRFKLASAALFYRVINVLSEVPIPLDTGDFRLVSRRVLEDFLGMGERHRFVRGMIAWLGYPQVALEYVRQERFAGVSKYPLGKMIRLTADALTGFSTAPLRLASSLAYLSLLISVLLAFYVFGSAIFGTVAPGWASLLLATSFFSGMQLLTLGILGEYVGRLYTESKARPLFLVSDHVGGAGAAPRGGD